MMKTFVLHFRKILAETFSVFAPLNFCKVSTHNCGVTFKKGEDISKYSRHRWSMVHTSSSSRMLPPCSGSICVTWDGEREESQRSCSMFLLVLTIILVQRNLNHTCLWFKSSKFLMCLLLKECCVEKNFGFGARAGPVLF